MDYEVQLLWKMGVKIYKIPPMSTNQGYYLDSWKEHKIAEVNMKVVGKGHTVIVQFLNPDNTLFAAAPMPEDHNQALVRCTDSSRGYAIRLTDPKGKHIWLGMVFGDRNDSFDFHTCLEDFEKTRDMELHPEKYAKENEPTKDFTLKKGEKLVLNVGGIGSNNSTNSNTSNNSGGGSFKLPPPGKLPAPSSKTTTQQVTGLTDWGFGDNKNTNTTQKSTTSNNDLFSDFGFGSNNTNTKSSNQDFGFGTSNNSNNNFGSFGSNNNQSNNNFDFFGNSGSSNNQGGFGGFGGSNSNNKNNTDLLGGFGFGGQNTSNNNNNNKSSQGNTNLLDLL